MWKKKYIKIVFANILTYMVEKQVTYFKSDAVYKVLASL